MIGAAYAGSDDLRAALDHGVPCGCDLVHTAVRRAPGDPRADVERELGVDAQRRWGCPGGGFAPPDELDPECRETLEAVSRVTGTEGFARCATCPMYGASAPWVRSVLTLHHWRDKGAASVVAPLFADAAAVEALDVLDAALGARQSNELERRREEAADRQRAAEQAARDAHRTR